MRRFWKWLMGRGDGEAMTAQRSVRTTGRVLVLQFGALGGAPMGLLEQAKAVRDGRDSAAFRATVQLIEQYFLNAQAMALWDQRIADGTSDRYLMAQSYLMDLLADLTDLAEGRELMRRGKLGEKVKGQDE